MKNSKKKVKRAKSKLKDNKIKFYLDKIGMSQQELADLCDTNRAHINRIINNKNSSVTVAMAIKICKVLGQPIEKVFSLTEIA